MNLLHHGDETRGKLWHDAVSRALPQVDFRCWPDVGNPADIEHLVGWTVPTELIASLPNLRTLFSIGAGVDQLDLDRLPPDLRIVRMIEPGITDTMADYVAMAVLALHRDLALLGHLDRLGFHDPVIPKVLPGSACDFFIFQ